MLRRGDILEDRYRIEDIIDEGGMSKVWRATDLYINATWAVKEINKRQKEYLDAMDENGKIPEFEFMKTLNHPAFPRVVHTIDEPGALYIIMDYVEGENLLKILELYGKPKEEAVAAWMIEACDAIDYLHQNGIIHRDIKPSNMMVDKQGNLKIIDMGSACYKGQEKKRLGTYGYASPEHHIPKVSERSDVYSVGMTMYHLLTGIDPTRKSFKKKPLREVDPAISSGLSKIVDKCTEKEPEDRYESVKVLADTLYSYKKLEDEYILSLRKKMRRAFLSLGLGLLGLAISVFLIILGSAKESRTYDALLNSQTTSLEKRVEELTLAADLKPKEVSPYIEMIRAYSGDGFFTEDELGKVEEVYQSHKEQLKRDSASFAKVNYEIGEAILTYYTGLTDNSNRAKLMAALPYFENAKVDGFSKEPLASGYSFMGRYYNEYVLADNSLVLGEVNKEDYENLLTSAKDIIVKLDNYSGDPLGKMRLITYDIVLSLIDNQRTGFAKAGIPKEEVIAVIDLVSDKEVFIEETDPVITEMKDGVRKGCLSIKEKVFLAYEQKGKIDD